VLDCVRFKCRIVHIFRFDNQPTPQNREIMPEIDVQRCPKMASDSQRKKAKHLGNEEWKLELGRRELYVVGKRKSRKQKRQQLVVEYWIPVDHGKTLVMVYHSS